LTERWKSFIQYGRDTAEEAHMAEPEKKVLVVDDEKHIRMLYREELEAEGMTVATSSGEEDILELLEREKPKVVILDIKLGANRSGLDLLQEIRSQDQDLPVILSTAFDSFQHDLKSIAADYYVVKSVDLSELKSKVDLAMKKALSQKH
jgi:DNA-binding response OmpR family regulator